MKKQKNNSQKDMSTIRIMKETKEKIICLAEKKDLKQITTLEYLLSGKIKLKEL